MLWVAGLVRTAPRGAVAGTARSSGAYDCLSNCLFVFAFLCFMLITYVYIYIYIYTYILLLFLRLPEWLYTFPCYQYCCCAALRCCDDRAVTCCRAALCCTALHRTTRWGSMLYYAVLCRTVLYHWCLWTNTPSERKILDNLSLSNTKSGAGELFLPLCCKARARVKGIICSQTLVCYHAVLHCAMLHRKPRCALASYAVLHYIPDHAESIWGLFDMFTNSNYKTTLEFQKKPWVSPLW